MTKTTEADVDAGSDVASTPPLRAKKKPDAAARAFLHDDLDAGWEDSPPPAKVASPQALAATSIKREAVAAKLPRAPIPPKALLPAKLAKAPKPSKRAPKNEEKRALREAKKDAKRAAARELRRIHAQAQTANRAAMKAADKARARVGAKIASEKESSRSPKRALPAASAPVVGMAALAARSAQPAQRSNARWVILLFLAAAAALAWMLKH